MNIRDNNNRGNRKPPGDYDIILNAPKKKKDWRIRGIKPPKGDWRIAGLRV